MLMYQKIISDRYFCIKHSAMQQYSKTFEKMLQKILLSSSYKAPKKHVTCQHFENATSRAINDNIILMSQNCLPLCMFLSDADVRFCDSSEMLISKSTKLCINST